MTQLTDVVWPAIHDEVLLEKAALAESGDARVALVEAAVLLEAGWGDLVDEVWCMSLEPEAACARLMERNDLTADYAMKRIGSQMSNAERVAQSDVVIDSSGSIEDTAALLEAAWE